jgi:GTPase SAR1 family protein
MKENSSNSSNSNSENNSIPLESKQQNFENNNFSSSSNSNLSIRISIFGESKSGKTSLINCYLKKSFSIKNEDTILNIHSKKILINNKNINLIISEISSNQNDFSLLKQITNESHIIFLTYNLEEKLNENILNDLLLKINNLNKFLPIFIVGCKLDLIKEDFIEKCKIYDDYDELSFFGENVQEFIKNKRKKFNIEGFYITSAMLNINIDKLFNDAIKTVCFPFVLEFYNRKNDENDDEILNKILNVNENGCKIF